MTAKYRGRLRSRPKNARRGGRVKRRVPREDTTLATFSVHFDGAITVDHKVSVRVLANTYEHMQRAIDRAYLIEAYGEVWKHQRLTAEQYQDTEFLALYPEEGGIRLGAFRDGAGRIVDRIYAAIRPVFEAAAQAGLEQHASMDQQLGERRLYVQQMGANTQSFEAIQQNPPQLWAPNYSNRSIVKEIDQLVSQVTPDRVEGSTVDLTFHGEQAHLPLQFDAQIAQRFHKIAGRRELGAAMLMNARIRSLDRGNRTTKPSAKIVNLHTNREVNLQLSSHIDFDQLHPHHGEPEVLLFVCPIVEAAGFDLNGGDLMYLAVAA